MPSYCYVYTRPGTGSERDRAEKLQTAPRFEYQKKTSYYVCVRCTCNVFAISSVLDIYLHVERIWRSRVPSRYKVPGLLKKALKTLLAELAA